MADETGPENTPGMKISTYGEEEPEIMQVSDWNKRWEKRQIGFHKEQVHELLEKHLDTMINKRETLRVFFPLCGKAVDMKWLADLGHTAVGVDGSEMALTEFFEEQKLEYTREEVEGFNGHLLKSKDGRIKLYCGDFYHFNQNVDGQFDAVWDRGSFVAINRTDRERYSTLMTSLMAPNCRYLLSTLIYDQSKYPGPPHCATVEDIQELYGPQCTLEEIDSVDSLTDKQISWGLDSFVEKIILIERKGD